MTPSPVVFLDIAGPDDQVLKEFYFRVFGYESTDDGGFAIQTMNPLSATIRRDPSEVRLYFGVDDVSAKLADVVSAGGVIDKERFEVPGVVVLGLFRDPAGNPMGLVEMEDGKPKLP